MYNAHWSKRKSSPKQEATGHLLVHFVQQRIKNMLQGHCVQSHHQLDPEADYYSKFHSVQQECDFKALEDFQKTLMSYIYHWSSSIYKVMW